MTVIASLAMSFRKRTLGEFIDQAHCMMFTKWMPKRTPLKVSFDTQTALVHHRGTRDDLFAVWQCFNRKQYEIPRQTSIPHDHRHVVDRCYRNILERGNIPLIIDCGANIGAGSLWLSMRYPSSTIIAVEPMKDNVSVLTRNAQQRAIKVVEGAIGPADGRMRFIETGSSLSSHIQSEGTAASSSYEVDCFTIKSICDLAPSKAEPLLLKVDIEGAESNLFQENYIAFDQFPLIIIEPHDFMIPGCGTASSFLRFHSERERDFLFWEENIFSIRRDVFQTR